MSGKLPYNIFAYERFHTVEVRTGSLTIGGMKPIRVQSMCNTSTTDIKASLQQAKAIINAGGELVRFTVRHRKDAEALVAIKQELLNAGIETPIVADVHFNADLASMLAEKLDKVRINPGNFIDKRARFEATELTNNEWNKALNRLDEKLSHLIAICKKHGTALRIGTNHGSLSDRIMSRYGNTVEGMVESTMEFLRICVKHDFWNVVVSLKSSNVGVMIRAYRALVMTMADENMQFPLHLGVTEAGDGFYGRIKSAAGIGTLLADGLGDTIRVSLTENPVNEIPVARKLVQYYENKPSKQVNAPEKYEYNPVLFKKREIINHTSLNSENPAVIIDLRHCRQITETTITNLGYQWKNDQWEPTRKAAEYVFVGDCSVETKIPEALRLLYEEGETLKPSRRAIPVYTRTNYTRHYQDKPDSEKWVYLRNEEFSESIADILQRNSHTVIVLETTHPHGTADQRAFFLKMKTYRLNHPVVIKRNYIDEDKETMSLKSAADAAPLFTDGYGDGLWLTNPFILDEKFMHYLNFAILQAARARSTSTEYIACPSCGRTQFDIEKVLKEVKARTKHLYHLKIAVMGCIVNGPGEMADADYGYVGSAPGKVTLYKGQQAMRKNISSAKAVDELIKLIKDNNDWIDT